MIPARQHQFHSCPPRCLPPRHHRPPGRLPRPPPLVQNVGTLFGAWQISMWIGDTLSSRKWFSSERWFSDPAGRDGSGPRDDAVRSLGFQRESRKKWLLRTSIWTAHGQFSASRNLRLSATTFGGGELANLFYKTWGLCGRENTIFSANLWRFVHQNCATPHYSASSPTDCCACWSDSPPLQIAPRTESCAIKSPVLSHRLLCMLKMQLDRLLRVLKFYYKDSFLRFTKCCAEVHNVLCAHGGSQSAVPAAKSANAAPDTKSAPEGCTKCCACDEIWTSRFTKRNILRLPRNLHLEVHSVALATKCGHGRLQSALPATKSAFQETSENSDHTRAWSQHDPRSTCQAHK